MVIQPQLHPNSVTHLPYRTDIDGLRALAVILVIFFHAFPNVFKSGFIGVDIFFVISGYLISSFILKNLFANSFNFSIFYSRRVNRIFPALLFTLITLFCLSWHEFIPDDLSKVAKHVFGSSTFLSNLIYLSEAGYFDEAADHKPLLHLWSLAIEEQFYIVWPITLALAFRFRLDIFKVIILCLLCSFALNIYRASYDTNFASINGQDAYGGYPDEDGKYNYRSSQFITANAWGNVSGFTTGYVNTDGHSKIIGFAADGYPIYGPFGYLNPSDSSSGV
ncbi:MAG: YHYH protein, partial [Gammaproteobacteria bacterium]|nr:YHYH protein [Gammaproteobacteria bacterium]